MEVVKVSGLDGRPSGRDSGLLKIIGLDDASYYRTERSSPFFTSKHTCVWRYVSPTTSFITALLHRHISDNFHNCKPI
jgi:hypothetical protein